jgi:hypothetical protein
LKGLTSSSPERNLCLKRLGHTASMSIDLLLSHGVEAFLSVVLLCVLAALVYRMLRSTKPDPHMTLLLALMGHLPKDEDSGSGGSRTANDPESHEEPESICGKSFQL